MVHTSTAIEFIRTRFKHNQELNDDSETYRIDNSVVESVARTLYGNESVDMALERLYKEERSLVLNDLHV